MKHALIRLREERRILSDSYAQVIRDRSMAGDDPAGRSQMLVQLLQERREVSAAIELIEAHMPAARKKPAPFASASIGSPPSPSAAPAGRACS